MGPNPHNTPEQPLLRPVMPELDSLRGIAILGVVLYHGLYWGIDVDRFAPVKRAILTAMWMGRLGVSLFFVLSGFLITGLLLDSRNQENYYRRFYRHRILRITPAYLVTLLILLVTKTVRPVFVLLSLAYLSNLTPLWGVEIGYPVLWSLAVEEHFYLLWPLWVRKFSERGLAICCGLIVVLSPLSRAVTYLTEARQGHVSYLCNDYTWNSADGLACGALLAILLRTPQLSRKKLTHILIGLVVISAAIWAIGLPFGILTRRTLIGSAFQVVPWHFLFGAVLVSFLLVGTSPWKKWITPGFLLFLGKISYGLYLYHLLCFWGFEWLLNHGVIRRLQIDLFAGLLIRMVTVGGVAVLMAWISRKFLEEPFLRLKDRWT